MERVGIYFQLKQGAKEAYVRLHQKIGSEMRQALDQSGMRNYSIFMEGAKLFAYYEVEDKERMEQALEESAVYRQWRSMMEDYVWKDPKTGRKEWFMEQVFYNRGSDNQD